VNAPSGNFVKFARMETSAAADELFPQTERVRCSAFSVGWKISSLRQLRGSIRRVRRFSLFPLSFSLSLSFPFFADLSIVRAWETRNGKRVRVQTRRVLSLLLLVSFSRNSLIVPRVTRNRESSLRSTCDRHSRH